MVKFKINKNLPTVKPKEIQNMTRSQQKTLNRMLDIRDKGHVPQRSSIQEDVVSRTVRENKIKSEREFQQRQTQRAQEEKRKQEKLSAFRNNAAERNQAFYQEDRATKQSYDQQQIQKGVQRKKAASHNAFIDNIQNRIAGSSASRETVEEAFGKVSKSKKWQGMNETERISAVVDQSINNVARKTVMGRMSQDEIKELSGNATLHKVVDERAAQETKAIQERINNARKQRSSSSTQSGMGPQASAQEEAISNTGAGGGRRSRRSANEPDGFDFDSVDMSGATRGGVHAFNRKSNDVKFAEANLNRALSNEDVASAIKNRLNIDDNKLAEIAKDPTKRNDLFRDRLESAKSNPTMMDNMWGNKVPQIAGGALLTAGLVSSMSNSKGQQSNAALYGQSQPYY